MLFDVRRIYYADILIIFHFWIVKYVENENLLNKTCIIFIASILFVISNKEELLNYL